MVPEAFDLEPADGEEFLAALTLGEGSTAKGRV